MKLILVTGVTGFIGGAFVRIFSSVADKVGWHIIPMVRKPIGLSDEVVLDFNDTNFKLQVRSLPCVDAIVHFGADVDFKKSLDEIFIPNVQATDILVNWAKNIGAYFMFASSIVVYGAKSEKIEDGNAINLDTSYARSKWMAEKAIEASGSKHLILRLAGVYGNDGSQSLGINRAVAQAQRGELPTQFGDGQGKRNYLYIVDLVHMMIYWLKSQTTGTHLVSGSEIISIADMLQAICDVFMEGQKPILKEGDSEHNQIVVPSSVCWHTRRFKDALQHMKLWHERECK